MNKGWLQKIFLLIAVAIAALAFLFATGDSGSIPGSQFSLKMPAFVGTAQAASGNPALAIVQSEAGISAYFQATSSVSISSVATVFQTIELQTGDYILGTLALAGYPENYAPHVYVHMDGWFMAYYLNSDPAAKIIDWNAYTASSDTTISTTLENALAVAAGAAGVGIPGITHYDFRYPNATTMMIITERDQGPGNDFFTVNIPSSFGVSERSWSISFPGSGSIVLNGSNLYSGNLDFNSGTISAAQMPPNTTHTIAVTNDANDLGGLAFIYSE